jgi:transcription elongation factor GreA
VKSANRQDTAGSSLDEVVLTPEGFAKLEDELHRLVAVRRPDAAARLSEARDIAGDLMDNPELLDAQFELEGIDQRIEVLEHRLHTARVLVPEDTSTDVVSLGSHVVLEDLDDSTREAFVVVSSPESDPAEGRLSTDSPVGRAIAGHHEGDVVDARAPHRVRHLRIVELVGGR